LILEIVASYDLWIWHAFFGCPRSINDLQVLDRSPVFQELYEGRSPKCEYVVNSRKYSIGYYLSDGIYQKWATFVKTIRFPQGPKAKLFVERQKSVQKDVERAFGVLQARFAIIRGPARHLEKGELDMIMKACVILHNIIVEDKRDSYGLTYDYEHVEGTTPEPNVQRDHHPCYSAYLCKVVQVRNPEQHAHLQSNLIEEIWSRQLERQISQP